MKLVLLFIVVALVSLVCTIFYLNRKHVRKAKNVDGFTGKVVETFPDGICKVNVSTDEGVVTIMASNEINVCDGDFVILKQDGEKICVEKRTGFWNI